MGVIHRDLKPEKFLLVRRDEDSPLKATGFRESLQGYSWEYLLCCSKSIEAELWEGDRRVEYILLSGVPPFWAETERGIFDEVLRGHIDFESEPWPSISTGAKDLIRKMLTMDPRKRITAAQVLGSMAERRW